MTVLSESRFRSLCDEAYRDRYRIYEFNPTAPHVETVLWVTLGSLYSLLSLTDEEIPQLANPTADAYVDAICTVVDGHRDGQYQPRLYLNELARKIEADDRHLGDI